MVKLKYNSKNVDRSKSGGVPPQPGTYKLKVVEVKYEEDNGSHEDRLVFKSRMMENDEKGVGEGYHFWDYVNLSIDWKVDQWLQAAGVDTEKRESGEFDTRTFKDLMVLGRIKSDTYQGEYKPKLAGVFELIEDDDAEDEYEEEEEELDDAEVEEADEDEEDYEDEEEEEEEEEEPAPPPRRTSKKAPAKKAAAKPKVEEPADDEDDYDDWSQADLKAECGERGLGVGGSKTALIARLRLNDADPFSEDED